MIKRLGIVSVLLLLGLGIYWAIVFKYGKPDSVKQTEVPEVVSNLRVARLLDVTDGSFINGYSTKALAEGQAQASFEDGIYTLEVVMYQLPELDDGYYYEGWVIRNDVGTSVISTGKAFVQADGRVINKFESDVNLLDHTKYVLTLEPDDGDPAPADHVLEGTFELQ